MDSTITQQSEALSDPENKKDIELTSNEVHHVASAAECTIASGGGSCTSGTSIISMQSTIGNL